MKNKIDIERKFKNNQEKKDNEIIKKHLLLSTENEQKIQHNTMPIDELFDIASVFAFYIIKQSTYINFPSKDMNISELSDKLTSLSDKNISVDKLNILFKTALFKNNEFSFFDSSYEANNTLYYLASYYLNKFDIDKIKEYTLHKLGVVNNYEETLVYLTQMKPELFDVYIDINPFIFRRHFDLDANHQEKLLVSLIHNIQKDDGLIHNKENLFNNSSLIRFDKLDNIEDILYKALDNNKINRTLYLYFLYLNISYDFFLKIWGDIKEDNFREIVQYVVFNDSIYNQNLFEFMKKNNLFKKVSYDNRISALNYKGSFEINLLKELYKGNISIDNLDYLLQYIDNNEFKDVLSLLTKVELDSWFEYLEKNYDENKHHQNYIIWCIYGLLKYYTKKETVIRIISFLNKNNIVFDTKSFQRYEFPKDEIISDFWELYFSDESIPLKYINIFFVLLSIYQEELKKLPEKYPIDNHIEKYKELSINKNLAKYDWDFLFPDKDFNEEKKSIRYQEEYSKNYKIQFMTKFHYYESLILKNNSYLSNINDILGEYYSEFISELKERYRKNILKNMNIKQENSMFFGNNYKIYVSTDNINFIELFNKLTENEVLDIINNEKMYKKLFWLWVIYMQSTKRNFKSCSPFAKLNYKYNTIFIDLVIEYIKLFLKATNNKKISNNFKCIIDALDTLDKDMLLPLLYFIKELPRKTFKSLEDEDRNFLIQLLLKDKNNFHFVFALMIDHREKTIDYLKLLFATFQDKIMRDYMEYYNKSKEDKELYWSLLYVISLKPGLHSRNKYSNKIDEIDKKYIKELIIDFYEIFKKEGISGYPQLNGNKETFLWDKIHNETSILEELASMENIDIKREANILLKAILDKIKIDRIKLEEDKHNPQELIKILTNFRKDTPIKYTTHLWDMNFTKEYGNFDGYINKVTEQWEEIEGELKNLSPNIHRKVYDFLINKSPNTNWCSKDGDDISIGWSSLEGLKEWCDEGNDPFNFELEKSYTVEDKTISTFEDVINLFKQEIQIRNENDILESIFIDIEESLDNDFDGIFEIETIKLKGKSFYTDVEKFKNALAKIFLEIKNRKKFNKIVVEMKEYDDYNYMDLIITQIGSSANRTKEDMEKISNGGDMSDIKKSLKNLCDWRIDTSYEDKFYYINYLGDINTKIETRGFTHILRFYR